MGNETNVHIFPAAINKSQVPQCFAPSEVVLALIDQYGEDAIDMIQPINGVYRVDFTKKESFRHLTSKGLAMPGINITAINWREGMDNPKVRIEIGQLPKAVNDSMVLDALTKMNLTPDSKIEPHYWKNKETGKASKVKSGKRIVYVLKPEGPIPDNITIKNNVAELWYWGKKSSKPNVTEAAINTDLSIPVQVDADADVISPTQLAPPFQFMKPQQNGRGRSRQRRSISKRTGDHSVESQSPRSKSHRINSNIASSPGSLFSQTDSQTPNPGEAQGQNNKET